MTAVPDLLAQIRAQLDDVADNLRWIASIAYDGPTLDEPKSWIDRGEIADRFVANLEANGASTEVLAAAQRAAASQRDPDHQPGPKFDLQHGDHLARTSIEKTDGHLWKADGYLLVAVGPGLQPPVRERTDLVPAVLLRVRAIRWRADQLTMRDPTPVTRLAVGKAAHLVDMAWKDSGRPFQRGPATVGGSVDEGQKRCKVCGLRPAAPKCGGRCYTCRAWFTRHGYERPKTYDEDMLGGARDAKDRRTARGEGWGVS